MKEISFVHANRISKSQVVITIPQEIVRELKLEGGEKFKVLFDDAGGIHYQKAAA